MDAIASVGASPPTIPISARHAPHRPLFVSDGAKGMIVALWCAGRNTHDIAKALRFPEFEVANALPLLLARHRQMRGGGR